MIEKNTPHQPAFSFPLNSPNFLQKIYSDASDIIGLDYSFFGVNLGFLAAGEARAIELEQTSPGQNLLLEAKKYAEELMGQNSLKLVMGISDCSSETDHEISVLEGHRAGFSEVRFLSESVAAAIGEFWNDKTAADKIIASCVFRGNSFGESTSFGLAIIEIKNGIFSVKKLNGRKHKIDNNIVKETCLTTIRELDLKHIDEVLIVGRKDYVTLEKSLIKAVRRTFRPLFEGECKYTRGHEKLVAKGLAVYGSWLKG